MNKALAIGNGTPVAAGALLAALSVPAVAQESSNKIGFVSTFSGPPAVFGNDSLFWTRRPRVWRR
jgi:hypothetical protein